MPFDGSDSPTDLMQRFSFNSVGFEAAGIDAWRTLIGLLTELGPERSDIVYLQAFDDFLDAVGDPQEPAAVGPTGHPIPPECRVFVSHQQRDGAYAERIAYLATTHRFDYWLDLHDPALALANRTIAPTDPRYGIIIAAIVEIGLLNSTHVIAVHTSNSLASKWVPYEFGRAKARRIRSTQAAGWFEPTLTPLSFGEYVQLAAMIHGGEPGLNRWFVSQHALAPSRPGRPPCRPGSVGWHHAIPTPLEQLKLGV